MMERPRDEERIGLVRRKLDETGLDALIVSLPENVLLLSGYWPVVGTALAIATRDGCVAVIAPEDETALAEEGWADDLRTFRPVALDRMTTLLEAVSVPLAETAAALDIVRGRIGHEAGPAPEPAPYSAMNVYGAGIVDLLDQVLPSALLMSADEPLRQLKAVRTSRELERLRITCRIAERAFQVGAGQLRAGSEETEAAALFRTPLSTIGTGVEGVGRADGFAWCMSGANAAQAQGAYARSRARAIARGELVLIHCNSYADGHWSDITRTFSIGPPDDRGRAMYEAVFEARAAALDAIRPGVKAAEVDRAARDVLAARGFGAHFPHATGHGVGFAAIDPNARPRLHPKSPDVLVAGMVFNVEPAIYIAGACGMRHCDVVAVTATGAEVLTPFQARLEQLILP